LVNHREFYSVFKTEENFKVVNSGNTIGKIPFSHQIIEDEVILLSAKKWKITLVDSKAKRIEVVPANDGKKPVFLGSGAVIHPKIREKMLEILYSKTECNFLDEPSSDQIEIMRKDFSDININDLKSERPLLIEKNGLKLFSFTGTKINRTIHFLFNIAGIKNRLVERDSSFEIELPKHDFISKWNYLLFPVTDIDTHILTLLKSTPTLIDFSKWGVYLPDKYKVKLIKNKYYDFDQTIDLLTTLKLISNE
ncbi:MAG: hypothetical protein RLZZ165_1196, partial [Bacteroidota bacterium]